MKRPFCSCLPCWKTQHRLAPKHNIGHDDDDGDDDGVFDSQVETREDEEQSVKLAEILELLLAAGYFRARIKGLSPFDKVTQDPEPRQYCSDHSSGSGSFTQ